MELPEDAAFLPRIEAMVAQVRLSPHLELEVRLGTHMSASFEAGVSPEYSEALYREMTDPESLRVCWDGKLPSKQDFMYVYFDNDVRGCYVLDGPTTFERVRRVDHLDLKCAKRFYGLRVSLKEETPMPRFITTDAGNRVRLNTRFSMDGGSFRYDFSKCGEGANKVSACAHQMYMVEIELVRSEALLSRYSDREIAVLLLGSARSLLGRYSAAGKEERLELCVK